MPTLIYKEEAYQIIGHCMTVHRELGHGFLEAVYKDALEYEFHRNRIPYKRECPFTIMYQGVPLPRSYYADFTVYDRIILEAKALQELSGQHFSQCINYLKVSGYNLCLLVNFGVSNFEFKRIVLQSHS